LTAPKIDASQIRQLRNGQRSHTDRWTKEETDLFYELLAKWGQDYSIIEHEMKTKHSSSRTRNQI
jgi:hypothetical protein